MQCAVIFVYIPPCSYCICVLLSDTCDVCRLTFPRLILLPGLAGSWFFVTFGRNTLPKQVSLLAGYTISINKLTPTKVALQFTKGTGQLVCKISFPYG